MTAAVASVRRRSRSRRGMAPYYAYRAAEGAVRVMPRKVAYAAGSGLATALMAVVPRRFDGLRDNLRHVLPEADDRTIRRVARRNVQRLTHSWVNVMTMGVKGRSALGDLRIEGREHFISALERGRGVVVASMHYGAWETGLAMWNALGGEMALLAEQLHPPQLFERIAGARGNLGVQVVPLDVAAIREDPAVARHAAMVAMREVFRLLRSGVAVALAIDRDLIGNGEPMRFFDADARIPLGVVEIAIRSGAAIVPIALLPTPYGVLARVEPEISYDSHAPRDTEVRRVTAEVLSLWEQLIRERPELWHVLDRVWIEPPQVGSAA